MRRQVEQRDYLAENVKNPLVRYRFAIDHIKGKRVVDLGCGFGYGVYLLSEAGFNVIGFDKSVDAIRYARAHYPNQYVCLDIEDVSGDAEFAHVDATVCIETLCHLKDPQKFLDNIKTNELVVSAPIDPNPNDGYKYRLHSLSKDDFIKMVERNWVIKDSLDNHFGGQDYLVLYATKK